MPSPSLVPQDLSKTAVKTMRIMPHTSGELLTKLDTEALVRKAWWKISIRRESAIPIAAKHMLRVKRKKKFQR